MGASTWTELEINLLKELWLKGVVTSEISKTLGTKSRNAIIGKAYRLGLVPRKTVKIQQSIKISDHRVKFHEKGQIPLKDIEPNQCRFMGGGLNDFLCCGEEPIFKLGMCEKHYKKCIIEKELTEIKPPEREKLGHLFIDI